MLNLIARGGANSTDSAGYWPLGAVFWPGGLQREARPDCGWHSRRRPLPWWAWSARSMTDWSEPLAVRKAANRSAQRLG
jgi:hypothetical protein